MPGRVLTIVGSGSLRCAPAVFASLTAPRFEHALELRLFDANIERLDLMGRLLAQMLDLTRSEHVFAMHPNLGLALKDADGAIVCLHEDCARRMTGKTAARMLFPSEPADSETLDDLSRGDMNRPTPFNELSPMTLAALSTPESEGLSRDEVVKAAMDVVEQSLSDRTQVLNLTRDCEIRPDALRRSLTWPERMGTDERATLPHRILRWINGDYELESFVESHRESPVKDWLVNEFRAL